MFDTAGPGVAHPQAQALMDLPLNLIALIVSHLDDVADLARVCRTCRVLNYMTLPQLYKNLTLTSYDRIRYRDNFPEGCGSASPFSMGLNAVVTRPNVAALVRSFSLRGEWREDALEEHARVGRVPDSSMMLNIAVRMAIDKMTELETFNWDLNTKLLETVYLGLAKLPKLTSLTVRFPSSRHPRPTIALPPMPHLRSLKVTHIDPLCYPDDLSTLLFQSKKLRELKLHWSTRMREEQEPSVSLHPYFRKCIIAKSPLRLRKISLQNFYAIHTDDPQLAIDPFVLEEVTSLNSPGFDEEASSASFVEVSWPKSPMHTNLKSLRLDRIDKRGCEVLSEMPAIEKLYLVHPVRNAADRINSARPVSPHSSAMLTPASRDSNANGHPPVQSSQNPTTSTLIPQTALQDHFIQMIGSSFGPRLRHLLLPSRWALSSLAIGKLVRVCPNLEQLALATEISSFEAVVLLMPFLRKLRALRLLIPTPVTSSNPGSNHGSPAANSSNITGAKRHPQTGSSMSHYNSHSGAPPTTEASSNHAANSARAIAEIVDMDDIFHNQALGLRLADKEIYSNLKMFGLGWKAWELGEFYTVSPSDITCQIRHGDENTGAMASGGATTIGDHLESGDAQGRADGCSVRLWPSYLFAPSSPSGSVLGKRKKPDHDAGSQSSSTEIPSQSAHQQLLHPDSSQNPSGEPPQRRSLSQQLHPPNQQSDPQVPYGIDVSTLQTSQGEPLSDFTRSEITRCLEEPHVSLNPNEIVWRRKVKRAYWDILKDWEIWGQDVQEI